MLFILSSISALMGRDDYKLAHPACGLKLKIKNCLFYNPSLSDPSGAEKKLSCDCHQCFVITAADLFRDGSAEQKKSPTNEIDVIGGGGLCLTLETPPMGFPFKLVEAFATVTYSRQNKRSNAVIT